MWAEPESEAVRDGLRTLEHQNLPRLVDMLLHIEGLRGRGWGFDEIAVEMVAGPFDPPVGGTWSGSVVAEIIGVIEAVREEEDQQPPANATNAGDHQRILIRPPSPSPPTPSPSPPNPAPAPTPAPAPRPLMTSPVLMDNPETPATAPPIRPPTTSHHHNPPPLPELKSPTKMPRWPFAALCLLAAGAAAFYLVSNNGSNVVAQGTENAASETQPDQIGPATGNQPDSNGQTLADDQSGRSQDQASGSEDQEITDLAPTEGETDPADMMSIRVEPEAPEVIDPVTGQPIQAATATVRADGLLHLDGAFPTQADAERYVAGMAEVFGQANIVENYQINPAAPLPINSDVSLDKPVLFKSGTAEIDPSYYGFLEACGDVMKLNPQITMSIAAFTDSVGSEELNLELSQRRANAIYQFYLDYDLSQDQLQPLAFGEAEPVADNSTETGRQENRRAMLRLLDVLADDSADEGQ